MPGAELINLDPRLRGGDAMMAGGPPACRPLLSPGEKKPPWKSGFCCVRDAYLAAATMKSTAALTSSSDADEPPFGGIMPALPV